ncbi:MAG: hypothetical protein D6754_11680 [Alphaproteobacteria bacterium]|nr:MAG: hypothetical protein D6754_11680 [Alphaproteobacteria bacterium]
MQLSSFRCEVLLGQDREPSWPRIGDILAMNFPKSGGSPRIEPQRGGHAQLSFGPLMVEGTFIKYPSPGARDVAHAAHVVIYAEAPAPSPAARIELARVVTAIAGAVALRRDCVGAIWQENERVIPVDAFRNGALRLEEDEDPLPIWVEMVSRRIPADEDRPEMGTIHTVGMEAFFGRELELELAEDDEATQRGILGGIVRHLFRDADALQHRATFQIENVGDFVADMEGEGRFTDRPVCRLKRVRAGDAAAEKLGTGGRSDLERLRGRRCTAVILFDPVRLPEPEALIRAVERHARRMGVSPTLSERSPERIVADWGVVRGGGARRSEIIHRGWTLPPALVSFITAENADVVVRHPELMGDSAPILIREVQVDAGQAPSILGAALLAHLSAAILSLPGSRGIIWPTSGILMQRHAALDCFKGMAMEVPIELGVARLALELEDGRRVFVTRGLAELGEQDVLMTCDDPADQRMRKVFDSLVRALFTRHLTRRGGSFVNELDGAEFELNEESIEGIGAVLKARMIKPPKPPAGLSRLFRRWG